MTEPTSPDVNRTAQAPEPESAVVAVAAAVAVEEAQQTPSGRAIERLEPLNAARHLAAPPSV